MIYITYSIVWRGGKGKKFSTLCMCFFPKVLRCEFNSNDGPGVFNFDLNKYYSIADKG